MKHSTSRLLLVAMALLCLGFPASGAAFGQTDSITTAKSLEKLQDIWQMQELRNQINTVHRMYSPHAGYKNADGSERQATEAERKIEESDGKTRLAAIRKDFQGRTKTLVTQALGMRASAKKLDAETSASQKLQSGDYGWQEISVLAKVMAAEK